MLLHLTRRLLSTPPLKTGNYFEVFSITPTFKLDLTELSRVYKRLQAEFHPDKHANSSALEQENAAQTSALINEANKCLKDPYCRARLLLKIQNFDPNVQTMDMEFLSDMMDVNDEVEMCEDRETLSRLKEVNEAAIAELYVQFEEHFNANELKTAAERLAKIKYFISSTVISTGHLIMPKRRKKAEVAEVEVAEEPKKKAKTSSEEAEETTCTPSLRLDKLISAEYPEVPVLINTTKPRSKSFEVSYHDGEDVTEIWSGIKLGPPRKLKFVEDDKFAELLKEKMK
ncbi:hypothetical protein ACHWQZ_G012847 [Mnemiopsis leidyi]